MISRRYEVKSELDIKIDDKFDAINQFEDIRKSVIDFRLIEYKVVSIAGIRYGRFSFYHNIDIQVIKSKL